MSRRPHAPTDKTKAEVSALTSFGITQEDISAYLDIDSKTLRKYYERELLTGTVKANAAMAKRLFDAGIKDGNVPAMIFWLKTRARWKETPQEVELSGKDGGPIKQEISGAEKFAAILQALEKQSE